MSNYRSQSGSSISECFMLRRKCEMTSMEAPVGLWDSKHVHIEQVAVMRLSIPFIGID